MPEDNSAEAKQSEQDISPRDLQAESDKKKTLKEQFSDGKIPTGAHFGELIDAFVLNEALEADGGVLPRLKALERPTNGKFLEAVSIGTYAGAWDIRSAENGPLSFRPPSGSTTAWIEMPSRIGSLSRDTDAEKLPQIDALKTQPEQLRTRDFYLTAPRPGPFAVEVFATVTPDKNDDGSDAAASNFVSRLFKSLLRPPEGTSLIRGVALSSGNGAPPQVDYHATPLTTRRVAMTRAVSEIVLVAALIFFLGDKINTDIQALGTQDDWFKESQVWHVPEGVFCPVMGALAKVKLYTMPTKSSQDTKTGSDKNKAVTGSDGDQAGGGKEEVLVCDGTEDEGKGSGGEPPNNTKNGEDNGDSSGKTKFAPTANWFEELTGQKPASNGDAQTGGSGSSAPKTTNKNGDKQTAEPIGKQGAPKPVEWVTVKVAYSVMGLMAIALFLMVWLRTVPMWLTMRRCLSVEWVKDAKQKGGLKLVIRRRGLLATPTAKVRYHMTQLWG